MKHADLSNLQSRLGQPKDLAKELGLLGIMNLLRIVCEAYENLRTREYGKVSPTMTENEITEELLIELEDVWKEKYRGYPLYPFHQKSHGRGEKGRGNTPTIDFCFRHKYDSDSYFGAECKILREDNKRLCGLYIKEGVNRYLSGKYSKKCAAGSMIGYIIFGNTEKIIKEIKNKVDKLPNTYKNMKKLDSINGFNDHYLSTHERNVGLSPFNIHHLFFSFT